MRRARKALGYCLAWTVGLMALMAGTAMASPRVLVMGAVHDNPNSHFEAMKPMADYIAAALAPVGIESVEIVIVPQRSQMVNLLRDGRVDWVSETPFGAAYLAHRTGARYLARKWKDGAATYRSYFFTRKDSSVNSIGDLRDRIIAFEHRNSTSAFFVPASMMTREELPLDALATPRETPRAGSFGYVYSGNEYNTAIWVQKGLVDAGVLSDTNWRDPQIMAPGFIDTLKIFAQSDPLPRAVEVVRGNLDANVAAALARTLMAMDEDPGAQPVLAAYQATAQFDALGEDDLAALERIANTLPAFAEQFP